MNITLTPEAQAYVEKLLATGHYRDAEEAVNALVVHAKKVQQRRIEWLRAALEEGEQSGLSKAYSATNLDEFWDEIEKLSDTMLDGEVPLREDSAALPLQD